MKSRFGSAWLSLLVLVAGAVAIWQHQAILDWWRLHNYRPPASIVQLADHTTMTGYGRRLFYINHPKLDDKATFSGHCRVTEQTIVLGCYISNRGIFIFDVNDERLNGVREVTAAHEMLHAAYERLSTQERNHINQLVTDFYSTLSNQRVKDEIESYRQRDPGVVPNELHSILGTEVRSLTPELENYYQRYFTDRQKIVDYSEAYEKAFTDIKNKVADYDKQLASLKAKIDANEAELQTQSGQIDHDRAQLDQDLASGNKSAYNAAVPGFNQKVIAYNSLLSQTKALIEQYNSLVEQRNQLATQEQQLIEAIDSRLSTQQRK